MTQKHEAQKVILWVLWFICVLSLVGNGLSCFIIGIWWFELGGFALNSVVIVSTSHSMVQTGWSEVVSVCVMV